MGGGWWVDVGGLEIGCGGTAAAQNVRDFHMGERVAEDAWAVGWETWVG